MAMDGIIVRTLIAPITMLTPMGTLTIEAGKMRTSHSIGQGEPTIRSTK